MDIKIKQDRHATRKRRVRKKIEGTPQRPRLSVYKSNTNIYAQIIDDENQTTLVSANTLQKDVKDGLESGSNVEAAKKVGKVLAEKANQKGITTVVFDRNGYQFHGKVKALADSARENGLEF